MYVQLPAAEPATVPELVPCFCRAECGTEVFRAADANLEFEGSAHAPALVAEIARQMHRNNSENTLVTVSPWVVDQGRLSMTANP